MQAQGTPGGGGGGGHSGGAAQNKLTTCCLACPYILQVVQQAEDGTIDIEFPQPVKGWRDFAHIDDQLHISVGNRNSVVIVRRCEPPSFIA